MNWETLRRASVIIFTATACIVFAIGMWFVIQAHLEKEKLKPPKITHLTATRTINSEELKTMWKKLYEIEMEIDQLKWSHKQLYDWIEASKIFNHSRVSKEDPNVESGSD